MVLVLVSGLTFLVFEITHHYLGVNKVKVAGGDLFLWLRRFSTASNCDVIRAPTVRRYTPRVAIAELNGHLLSIS